VRGGDSGFLVPCKGCSVARKANVVHQSLANMYVEAVTRCPAPVALLVPHGFPDSG
jgi:hypothetical protein